MTRVPPIVFAAGALLALVVALVGLAQGWAEVTPVAFFGFVFCMILATIGTSLVVMQTDVPPTVEAMPHVAAHVDTMEQDGEVVDVAPRHMETIEVAHNAASQPDIADDDLPQRPA